MNDLAILRRGALGVVSATRSAARSVWKPLAVVTVLWVALACGVTVYEVPSRAMEQAHRRGDRLLVNRLAYGLRPPLLGSFLVRVRTPARGDVVLLDGPEGGRVLKRVVGLPGETVAIEAGRVLVDGAAIEDPWGGGDTAVPDAAAVEVPEGALYVLGDRRDRSRDSRHWGPVAMDRVVGRASWTYSGAR